MNKLCLAIIILFLASCASHNTQQNTISKSIDKKWLGEWERVVRDNGATLTIDSIAGDTINFNIDAASGGNTGTISGKAHADGNKALFFLADDEDTCIIKFVLLGDSAIDIEQVRGTCGAGMGVEYSGRYYNTKTTGGAAAIKREEASNNNAAMLDNPIDNSVFTALVRGDSELFINSTQLTDEDSDLDGFNAKVYASGVRGLFTQMENIIMINPQKDIWAAVIDTNKVLYYTNRKDWANKLPKTINQWRERFKQDSIVFMSAK